MMTKSDVFDFYAGGHTRGATKVVADALGKTPVAVYRWTEQLPDSVQFEIEVKSAYQLISEFTKERLKGEQ
ncbi:Cro/CI family transcriptional regulator [Aeromonas salmonicida]